MEIVRMNGNVDEKEHMGRSRDYGMIDRGDGQGTC